LSVGVWHYLAILVLLNLAHSLSDVESPSVVIKEFRKISIISHVRVMELHPSLIIDHITFLVNSVTPTAHNISSLIDKLTVRVLFDDWLSVSVVVKVPTGMMRVEVMLLNVEWGWNLSFFINFFFVKHFLAVHVIDDVAGFRICQVASLVSWSTLIILLFLCFWIRFVSDHVSFLISVQVTDDVTFIKFSGVNSWRYFHDLRLLLSTHFVESFVINLHG